MRLARAAVLLSLVSAVASVLLLLLPVNRHHSAGTSNVFGEVVAVPAITVRCGTVIGDDPGYMAGNDCAEALALRQMQGVGAALLSVVSLSLGLAAMSRGRRRRRLVRPNSM